MMTDTKMGCRLRSVRVFSQPELTRLFERTLALGWEIDHGVDRAWTLLELQEKVIEAERRSSQRMSAKPSDEGARV